MAIYRSDQAQLTFAAEVAQGADSELVEGTAGSGSTTTNAATSSGSRTVSVTNGTAFQVGDTIRIGTVAGTASQTVKPHESRKIEGIQVPASGDTRVFELDRPVAFTHASGQEVKEITAIGGTAARNSAAKFITFIPGVYETVDTPDPEMSIEGRRFLNTTSKRNWNIAYPGQQTLSGSVGSFTLLNGWALRFPIGSVVTTPTSLGGTALTLAAAANKGDVYVTTNASTNLAAGDYLNIDDGSSTKSEVRRLVANPTGNVWKLNYPLQFAHDNGVSVEECAAGTTYTHSIVEQAELDTVSWNVHMLPTDEDSDKAFNRRYVGGMVDSTTISAEEGGMVTMSWDGVNFLDMIHNQASQTTVGTNLYNGSSVAHNMPRYALTQSITATDVGAPSHNGSSANDGTGFPTTQPYYFSEGTIKFFGQEFARIRSFSLSISNGSEPRYYIGKQGRRRRGPYEIKEGPREYSMSATVALPDASVDSNAAHGSASQDGALELFRQLLLEGDYGSDASPNRKGFTATIKFQRGADDHIIIDIPTSGTVGDPSDANDIGSGLNNQGIMINTATHSITTDNPFQVDVDMIFRSIKITIKDTEPVYP
ncbi:MAG TPA: hypothetical protein DCM40_46630 [Maribacter sp.]|nr:hypothetical protein [Maribacter sp.]|tara:strand:+ start:1079 stop:2863 length:1785 start_codon:yes stop_codon:yes gene_type:complete